MARILFIEPDRILGANAKTVMKRAGHSVELHVDPQAAMNSADAVLPDVIILDLLLAGRSGVEFLYEFRSYPEWLNVPVIIYSNVTSDEFNEMYIGYKQLKIARYHHKPTTTLAELLSSVERALAPALS